MKESKNQEKKNRTEGVDLDAQAEVKQEGSRKISTPSATTVSSLSERLRGVELSARSQVISMCLLRDWDDGGSLHADR